ncbi:MAG: tRNA (adenosine(37)-N6)-threonylcarbamoyltransferase complex ATPase subunit type 1 TsaE, partial [Bacteroidales bacterium]|nr:tRNA (adenosine(37)-N6)-threonylcarbamoyltransferase complex ATPase subunit type 1 TsaE [Bacteroidales bacterium]
FAGNRRIFAFYGSLGSGKTTFIKAICKKLGVVGNVNSPTFTVINEYKTRQNNTVYHVDLYRIKNQQELYDTGLDEYLSGESYCFIEWPDLAVSLLPPETVTIKISVENTLHRILDVS